MKKVAASGLQIVAIALLLSFCMRQASAVVVDTTTHGDWVVANNGARVYGNGGYILPSAKALIKQQYSTIENNDGSLTDLVSLPSWVSGYTYNDPGSDWGWYGEDSNMNPVNSLAALEDPTDQSVTRQVGANLYVDFVTASVPTITLNLTGSIPSTFELGVYGSPLGRVFSQHAGSSVYTVNGETVTYLNSDADFQAGVWSIFTINGATAGPLEIAVTPIPDSGFYLPNSYAFISAITLDFDSAPSQPGDFDVDGDVDGADFVVWQTNFPKATGGTLATGDADSDGDVDGADFVVWQTNFPFTPGPAITPVPEPAAFLIAMLGGLIVASCRRRPR